MIINILHGILAAIGVFYLLFLPGFAVSYLFFARGKIDIIERSALSLALSIAIVPLITFYLNLVGLKIRLWTVFLETVCVILTAVLIAKYTGRLEKPSEYKKHN